jgi:hypothetical protein
MDNDAVGVIDDRTEDSHTDSDGFRVTAFFDLRILVLELAQYASAGSTGLHRRAPTSLSLTTARFFRMNHIYSD